MIDVIVPTVAGREASLERLIVSVEKHVPEHRLIVIEDAPSCGVGWQRGLEHSAAPYVLLACDDIELRSSLDAAVEAADAGALPAPVITRPDGTLESAGGDMNQPACLIATIQDDWWPVDFSPMPFGTWKQVTAVGMIAAHYMTDVYFSHKARQQGIETVLRTPWHLTHHHELPGRRQPTGEDQRLYETALRETALRT